MKCVAKGVWGKVRSNWLRLVLNYKGEGNLSYIISKHYSILIYLKIYRMMDLF